MSVKEQQSKWPKKQGQETGADLKGRTPSSEGTSPTLQNTTAVPEGKDHENRKILVVGQDAVFHAPVIDYAISLAERLGYDLIAMNVHPGLSSQGVFYSPYRKYLEEKFKRQARAQAELLKKRVTAHGVRFEHLVKFGDLVKAVDNLNQERKRIEFVINASELNESEMTAGVTLPVFTIKGYHGEELMANQNKRSGKLIGKTIALGLGAAALYAAVFSNSGFIMKYFTRGGWYAALPIATVFVFSFVHGAFASNVWEVLGISAPKKTVTTRPTAKRPTRRQRPRPRLRLNV